MSGGVSLSEWDYCIIISNIFSRKQPGKTGHLTGSSVLQSRESSADVESRRPSRGLQQGGGGVRVPAGGSPGSSGSGSWRTSPKHGRTGINISNPDKLKKKFKHFE